MTEFFKLIGLKHEADWLNLLTFHSIRQSHVFIDRDDAIASRTYYYHQTEHETGGANPASFIFLFMEGQRRITIAFEAGILQSICVPTNHTVTI